MNIQNNLSSLLEVGLTQVEIGRAINRSQATISEMLSGKSGCVRPSADVVEGIKKLMRKHRAKLKKNGVKP
jgi:transcriptional regulator with XRE-family HTH domain